MRGFACAHAEKRHRLDRTFKPSNKGYIGSYYAKDAKYKPFSALLHEGSSGKLLYVKLVLVLLMCGSFMGLLHSPSIHLADEHHHTQPEASKASWMSHPDAPNSGYASSLKIDWSHVEAAVKEVARAEDGSGARVALLNFGDDEVGEWRARLPHTAADPVHLDRVGSDVTWEHLYPEWIDEEELYGRPACPDLPEPAVAPEAEGLAPQYDIVAVKLPCGRAASWSKDVARLHLQLAAARLATRHGHRAVHVLVVSRCFPMPNLFKCKDEVARDGDVWLYRPDVDDMRRKLELPVGSCKLAMPFKALGEPYVSAAPQREAYATILHSEQLYSCGAITAAQSIRLAGSDRDMVALVDETISARHRGALEAAGWKVRTIRRIRNPRASPGAYNEWNYSKFWLWTLTEYDRVIFLDADLLVQRPMEPLFAMPEVSATGNNGTYFNSGVMVVEPCNCTFRLLAEHVGDIESYNGGDQGYLNEVFSWWHRLPSHANYMKHFWEGDTEELAATKRRVLAADPPVALAVHFVGLKPWFCFRDYDCNWNVAALRQFASDEAHARWWKVHDTMPPRLQGFCLLDERQKALLRWDVARAREANFSDGHWSVRIADPRRRICAGAGAGEACREREIAGRRVEGNRITTSYAKLIDNF
ncbi:putative UDP-glucuronate:xylan alpha-glucuronosyltransferase 3 isoform X2 [Phragmites australis]|uniref:putative UDP-glucuronate:xylan alpha-glucuronosyltransferase 3 isoform X2 n=1 Tax=Phragmites australis TaxID=29695 RepID=UPI002D78C9C3|nr:putative UDP-glucuronate:xylan alpha-glucuronosyltransferase 3 isoform X2 [Phragmites australis]